MSTSFKKHLLFTIFLVFIFFFAIAVWYSPVLFKGYPSQPMEMGILLARNYSQTGVLGMEDNLNIFLAPSLVAERANISTLGNKLTSLTYGLIFKITGPLELNQLVILSSALHATALLFFTLLIFYLFGWQVSIIFSLIYIFLPFQWQYAQFLASYEIAVLFFSLFTLLYFWGRKQKFKLVYLVLAGIFLALTVMAREAFLLSVPAFFIFLLWQKRKFDLITVFIPFIILIVVFWAPSFFGQENFYFYFFKTGASEELKSPPLHFYGHLYTDPYTYHFAKEEFDRNLGREIESSDSDFAHVIGRIKVSANISEREISLKERLLVGSNNLLRHFSRFFAIEVIGGPLITLLLLLGLYQLKFKEKQLVRFFILWIISLFLLLAYIGLAIRNHLIDFTWVVALLVALGLTATLPILKNYFNFKRLALPIYFFIILVTLYNLVIASHVFWGHDYDQTGNLALINLSQKVDQFKVADNEVIATSYPGGHVMINYLTNKSIVYFSAETIDKLIAEGKVDEAFDQFGVKYIVGFSKEQTKKITENSSVINIATRPDKEELEAPISGYTNKMWFLNLVR